MRTYEGDNWRPINGGGFLNKKDAEPFKSGFQLSQLMQRSEVEECMRRAKLPAGTYTDEDIAWLHTLGICLPEEVNA
jgi:hypothetical protein